MMARIDRQTQSEQAAAFAALAGVMYATRRIDWSASRGDAEGA